MTWFDSFLNTIEAYCMGELAASSRFSLAYISSLTLITIQ